MANSKLSAAYNFTKPNDERGIGLMNRAAQHVFRTVPDLCIAYGVSDEYSFVFHKSTVLFERRASKLISTVVSAFTAGYIFFWAEYFGAAAAASSPSSLGKRSINHGLVGELQGQTQVQDNLIKSAKEEEEKDQATYLDENWLPTFDARAVCYPSLGNLRDYLSWRQVDCHINNLYNTTFWALVQQGGLTTVQAEQELKGTFSSDKNEILFSRFGINYNHEPDVYKKGSVVFREYKQVIPPTALALDSSTTKKASSTVEVNGEEGGGEGGEEEERSTEVVAAEEQVSRTQLEKAKKARQKARIVVEHCDIIKDEFWLRRPWILSGKPGLSV